MNGRKPIILTIAIMLLGTMMAFPIAMPEESTNNGTAYALIAAPYFPEDNPDPRIEAQNIRNWMLNNGWNDEQIIFLADDLNANYIDGTASKENIQSAINQIKSSATVNDKVIIIVLDHGEIGKIDSIFKTRTGNIYDYELGDWLNGINYKEMFIEVSADYSGGFLNYVQGDNRVVVSSHQYDEFSNYNEYSLYNGLINGNDLNQDGKISIQESHNYNVLHIQTHHPQIIDRTNGNTFLSL